MSGLSHESSPSPLSRSDPPQTSMHLWLYAQGRSPLRIIYAFDPERQAVLLIGGDKAGDPRFYRRIIATAERIWREYLTP